MTDLSRLTDSLAGRYTVDREVGRGGMATVYLARDVRHDRQVAIKVLNAELGAVLGSERFLAEIKVTANLQHPNLLPLFDSGEAAGLLFYVMPYVEGESLRARLDREKQLPVDEAIRIATAVANALDYAHSHGVIHRDLKPENILLQAGQPVVADFGIALAVSKAGGERVTQTGLSLGTPQYMSPEQATGDRTVDGRTDIYSLGAMTYEMLTGEPPHMGNTSQAIIAKLMTEEVRPLTVLRRNVPPHVDVAVRHALEKLPADRFATAKEFSEALQGRGAAAVTVGAAPAVPYSGDAGRGVGQAGLIARAMRSPVTSAVSIALAAALGAGWWLSGRTGPDPTTTRFALSTAPHQEIGGTLGRTPALSPDGSTLVWATADSVGTSRLFVRRLDDLKQIAIPGSEGASQPAFSPDGQSVAYLNGRQIVRIPLSGGSSSPVVTAEATSVLGITWSDAGVVFSNEGKLIFVPGGSGTPRTIAGTDSLPAYWPAVLPSGREVVFATRNSTNAPFAIVSLDGGAPTLLNTQGVFPLGVVAGELVYAREDGAIMSVPVRGRRLDETGSATVVANDVALNGTGEAKATISSSGSLAYVPNSALTELVIRAARGESKALPMPIAAYANPRFSPDGKRLAVDVRVAGRTDVWVHDIASGAGRRITTVGGLNQRPEWTPDGKRVLFRSVRDRAQGELWWKPVDGSGAEERLVSVPGKAVFEGVVSPDGSTLVFRTGTAGGADIWYRRLQGDTAAKALLTTPFTELGGRLSPDGKWIAYQSNESNRNEVYVRPFPGPGATVIVSLGGGQTPVWSPDGRHIYFNQGQRLIGATVTVAPEFKVVARETVFEGNVSFGQGHANFDVSPEGKTILFVRPVGGHTEQIVVVRNWIAERKTRRMGESVGR